MDAVLAHQLVSDLMTGRHVGGHGIDHFVAVQDHAIRAVACLGDSIEDELKQAIVMAAFLHDIDDPKIFKDSCDNCNARAVMARIDPSLTETVVEMINLVSCSHNGNDDVKYPYMAIPRDCDRLEAIGEIGIKRCREYAQHIGNPRHLDSTPRAYTVEDLELIATPERFQAYANGAKSVSEIDHYYDKLLHIGKPECLKSNNPYILEEAARRHQVMVDYVLEYWRNLDS